MTIQTRLSIPWTCPVCDTAVPSDEFHQCHGRAKPPRLYKRVARWFDDNWPLLFIGGLVVLVLTALVMVVITREAAHEEFTRQCTQDHKPYECELAWRRATADMGADIATGIAIGTIVGSSVSNTGARSYAAPRR